MPCDLNNSWPLYALEVIFSMTGVLLALRSFHPDKVRSSFYSILEDVLAQWIGVLNGCVMCLKTLS